MAAARRAISQLVSTHGTGHTIMNIATTLTSTGHPVAANAAALFTTTRSIDDQKCVAHHVHQGGDTEHRIVESRVARTNARGTGRYAAQPACGSGASKWSTDPTLG